MKAEEILEGVDQSKFRPEFMAALAAAEIKSGYKPYEGGEWTNLMATGKKADLPAAKADLLTILQGHFVCMTTHRYVNQELQRVKSEPVRPKIILLDGWWMKPTMLPPGPHNKTGEEVWFLDCTFAVQKAEAAETKA